MRQSRVALMLAPLIGLIIVASLMTYVIVVGCNAIREAVESSHSVTEEGPSEVMP